MGKKRFGQQFDLPEHFRPPREENKLAGHDTADHKSNATLGGKPMENQNTWSENKEGFALKLNPGPLCQQLMLWTQKPLSLGYWVNVGWQNKTLEDFAIPFAVQHFANSCCHQQQQQLLLPSTRVRASAIVEFWMWGTGTMMLLYKNGRMCSIRNMAT